VLTVRDLAGHDQRELSRSTAPEALTRLLDEPAAVEREGAR